MKGPVNVLFCGRGGQGVLTASEVVGWAAIYTRLHVKKSEVHGMAQRGGSVESHLRFGKEVVSPLIPKGRADHLVPFDAEEGKRLSSFLKPGGNDLLPYLKRAEMHLPDKKCLNIYMLGALSRSLPLKADVWTAAIKKVIPEKYLAQNLEAFKLGREEKI
ncbi:MAG TPA: indolepyruvate oxidoreductase subunit beta [Candidatus Omnitrophota bacterium]|nr:indolepyruvate oxidoreductase subunit beta [Candidatus Omnitrophota bacterium]